VFRGPDTCAATTGGVVSGSPPPSVTTNSPAIERWPGMAQKYRYRPGVSVTVASCRPPFASNGLARMFRLTSWL
jgi:hypothetical protein